MAHLPFVGRSLSAKPLTRPMCDQTPARRKLVGSVRSVVGWSRATAMMVRRRTEAGMALSGRGGFRSDTRTMRMERLHGPKGAHSGPRALSPEGDLCETAWVRLREMIGARLGRGPNR